MQSRLNHAHKSGDAWVRIASSVQSQSESPLFPNAPLAETARWKRCAPRLATINVLIAKRVYLHLHRLQLSWTSKRYCYETQARVLTALDHPTYFISLLPQPVELEIYIRLVAANKFRHYAIFPLLWRGRFLCGLRGGFGHGRIGEGSPRQRSKMSTVYNRAENEPRHEDYERREEMVFTHVISLF